MAPFFHSLRLNPFGRFRLFSPFPQYAIREPTTFIWSNTRLLCSVDDESELFECDQVHDDSEAMEKHNALRLALKQVAADLGTGSALSLQQFFGTRHAPVISTGSLKLDLALGIGGLPKGRMVEIYGLEASGKTTLALHIIKEAQRLGGYCAYLDAENALDPSLVESMGIDTKNLLISPPDSAERLLSVVDKLTKSGSVDVIVVDSVAALVPQSEIGTVIGSKVDLHSRIMTKALRRIHYSLCRSQTLIVFLNQVRFRLKHGRGVGLAEEATSGGNALKFYSAVRLRMVRTGLIKTEDKITGVNVSVQVVKNKMAPAMTNADIGIRFGKGFQCESDVLELACEHGVILREGSTYLIEGEVFSDKHAVEKYLGENYEVLNRIVMVLRRRMFEREI